MSFASFRTALTTRSNNTENEQKIVGKAALLPHGVGALKARPVRSAMQDIGNKAVTLRDTSNKGLKQDQVKPTRGLTKQKATVSLKNAAAELQPTRVQPKRKSAEKAVVPKEEVVFPKAEVEEHQLMETSKHELKDEDIEMDEAAPVSAFSSERMLLVEDIDKDDAADPQLVSEYVNQIYIYLRQLENDQYIVPDYLGGKKGGVIIPKMRTVLVDWLVEVHQQFTMLQETLYLTVAILDRFLQKAASKIPKKSLQLVGVTAMFIASKYEEMYAPEIGDFVYITDNAYTQAQIRQMEIEILRVLNFDLGRPLALHFLRRNSKAACVEPKVHLLAKYILELTILDYDLVHVAPSKLASAALVISRKFFDEEDLPLAEYWTETLAFYMMYEWSDLTSTVDDLLRIIIATSKASPDAKLMAIRAKYSHKKVGKIALVAQSRIEIFEEMMENEK